MTGIMKVCSHKPRSFGQDRGTFHVSGDGKRTFCGRDCSEWLRMGEVEDHEINSVYLCAACHRKAFAETA